MGGEATCPLSPSESSRCSSEYEALKAELVQCQEEKRRLEHANQMLQCRLRVNLDEENSRGAPGGGGSIAGF